MTSSLVGSEMCIRDSPLRRQVFEEWGKMLMPEDSWLTDVQVPTQFIVPVSYTHLTLPTICSV
eukprot:3264576-Prorocentrum_lima.AAC.1